ncbi:hypothetical protein HGRIS_008013 [Hohenbuehelia grisea]|uniref:Dilute domain-containing protein n=1 Tax=Hohenbuehelia grisea TaxID=104357 RepID=A0ABR3J723_9AGAR
METTYDLSPEPDLHPLYPTVQNIALQLSSDSGLAPAQKSELVAHCITRACVFGDISLLLYLISDPQAQSHVDLGYQDEDGLGLVSLTIYGFGAESDRDVEREECVRFLVSQGAELGPDKSGWTPLHHAALLSPPTLVSYLMTHGCSPFALTRRKLTPLDIVTAHSLLPGRQDVALLLEESMRGEGWTGGRVEQKRRIAERHELRKRKRRDIQNDVARVLGVSPRWWGAESDPPSDSESTDEEDEGDDDDQVYTPPADYASMLVFSPPSLPQIFDTLITNYEPSLRDATPANTLYLLVRFASLTCDHNWLEDLIIGATDAIEDTFFNRSEDISCLVFWLYNSTVWLHLLQCDTSINESCDMLGSFDLIEEVINSVFVFIIRFAERKIDQLIDSTILDFAPFPADLESVQFESEWSLLRAFGGKKKPSTPVNGTPIRSATPAPTSPTLPPISPSASQSTMMSKGFSSSIRNSFSRARGSSATTPLQSLFAQPPPNPSTNELTSFITALHTLLTLSDINPAFITQLWSQIMYWTSSEIFNRILTRKKYLCRSRAGQIGINLSVLEDWIERHGLPRGVQSHFAPVRDLLKWLQMRRAVRDYRHEVGENKMTEECIQYLTQLQKDWERHRVKLGVEAMRKEIDERDRDRDSVSSFPNDAGSGSNSAPSIMSSSSSGSVTQSNIDILFDRTKDKSAWDPVKPPQVLGELLDSRYMLPLLFPSDARLLGALPGREPDHDEQPQGHSPPRSDSRSSARSQGAMPWRARSRKLREVGLEPLQWVDGVGSTARWTRPLGHGLEDSEADGQITVETEDDTQTHITPLTRKPSGRSKGRPSYGGGDVTPVEGSP